MDIGRTEGVQGPAPIDPSKKVGKTQKAADASSTPLTDKVEISDGARLLSEVLGLPGVRQEKIEAIKQLIEDGKFDTEERLQGAIDELLKENPDFLA